MMSDKITVFTANRQPPDKRAGKARVRPSKNTLELVLETIREVGLPVDKLCVIGSRIEVHIASGDDTPLIKQDEGLKEW